MKKELTKSQQGKKNKRDGAKFELLVRKDLESKGWIVSKWMNNVEFEDFSTPDNKYFGVGRHGKLIPAKHKFCGFGRPMAIGTGFTDFICFKLKFAYFNGVKLRTSTEAELPDGKMSLFSEHIIIGVEAKSNGYLDKEEKEKCDWLLANDIFSKILIAKKEEKGVIYEEYGTR